MRDLRHDLMHWNMYQEAMTHNYDVAIVVWCLRHTPTAMIKKAGKQAIHWGRMSQIRFGKKVAAGMTIRGSISSTRMHGCVLICQKRWHKRVELRVVATGK